jgi:hypothetical protein
MLYHNLCCTFFLLSPIDRGCSPVFMLTKAVQWLRLALSNWPNRVDVSYPQLTTETDPVSETLFSFMCFVKYRTMDKVQKPSNPECYHRQNCIGSSDKYCGGMLIFKVMTICPCEINCFQNRKMLNSSSEQAGITDGRCSVWILGAKAATLSNVSVAFLISLHVRVVSLQRLPLKYFQFIGIHAHPAIHLCIVPILKSSLNNQQKQNNQQFFMTPCLFSSVIALFS